ncbi:uncharacterized protein V6R79_014815 [Siganus canaliculatus]
MKLSSSLRPPVTPHVSSNISMEASRRSAALPWKRLPGSHQAGLTGGKTPGSHVVRPESAGLSGPRTRPDPANAPASLLAGTDVFHVNTTPLPVNTPPLPVNTPPLPVNTPPLPVNTPPLPVNTPPLPVNTPPLPVDSLIVSLISCH